VKFAIKNAVIAQRAALLETAVQMEAAALFFDPLSRGRSIGDCRSNRDAAQLEEIRYFALL